MATYTITIDERTKSGKQVLNYLKSHGVIEIPNETTRKSNETENNPFKPIQERHKIGKTQEFARGRTQ